MRKNNNNDNIKTIDTGDRKGVIDLSFFDKVSNELSYSVEVCEATRDMVDDAAHDAVTNAHLEHVDFSVCDADNFTEGLLLKDNKIRDIIMEGEDDKFYYILIISAHYFDEDDDDDDDDLWLDDTDSEDDEGGDFELLDDNEEDELLPIEDPEEVLMQIFKVDKNDYKKCYNFDYDKDKWVWFDYKELIGMTDRQLQMFLNEYDDSGDTDMMLMHRELYGDMSDEEMDKMFEDNKELLMLYKEVSKLAYIDMLNDNTPCILPYGDIDGTAVIFKDGKYRLLAVLDYNIVAEAFATADLNEIIETFTNIAGKKPFKDTVFIFPLSGYSFMFVGETGESDYFYMYEKKDGKMTEKEVKIKDDFETAVRNMLEEEDD